LGILTKPVKSDSQLIPTYLLLRYNIKKKKSHDNMGSRWAFETEMCSLPRS
jgi:hypothetical protein